MKLIRTTWAIAAAITNNFSSALSKITSDPKVTELVSKTVGSKVPGILASLF